MSVSISILDANETLAQLSSQTHTYKLSQILLLVLWRWKSTFSVNSFPHLFTPLLKPLDV